MNIHHIQEPPKRGGKRPGAGRKSLPPGERTAGVTVHIPERDLETLKNTFADRSISETIRRAVREFIEVHNLKA